MKKGIDVSKWNGKINWNEMLGRIDFVIIRIGYGQNNIDEYARYNMSECNRLGIPVGVYWFSYALDENMVVKEANYCLKLVKDYQIDLPIAFDLEGDSVRYASTKGVKITSNLASKFFVKFAETIVKNGYEVMNYSNKNYIKNYFNESTLIYPIWFAEYNSKMSYTGNGKVTFWQFTNKMEVNGKLYDGNYMLEETIDKPIIEVKESITQIELPILKKGSFGYEVLVVQIILKHFSFYDGKLDSEFGDKTEKSVKAFQKNILLKEDGVVGEITWGELL